MNYKFDELTKGLAESITRRGAFKKFCGGLAGIVMASLGLTNQGEAQSGGGCVEWHCSCLNGLPYSLFICGNARPKPSLCTCKKVGPAPCGSNSPCGPNCC